MGLQISKRCTKYATSDVISAFDESVRTYKPQRKVVLAIHDEIINAYEAPSPTPSTSDEAEFSRVESASVAAGPVKLKCFFKRPPSPGLRVLTPEQANHEMECNTVTCYVDAGLYCWLWVRYAEARVFFNQRDRRLVSIGRISNCNIVVNPGLRVHPRFGVQKLVEIHAKTQRGMSKCLNLVEEKFPGFEVRNVVFPS
ncbi:unnamed protein product [Mesocestoides corti]|uniref:POLAc domain-containing protein n=1 Tax=Mesocestoides corti TaxID=53468 RepID=A0A0R3UP88_MESCO|nr:unnamed protein product [Mesocestoides corti]